MFFVVENFNDGPLSYLSSTFLTLSGVCCYLLFIKPFLFTKNFSFFTTGGASIVVHCSAGVGRTGTFIGLYRLMHKIKSDPDLETIDVFNEVFRLRENRCKMVDIPFYF